MLDMTIKYTVGDISTEVKLENIKDELVANKFAEFMEAVEELMEE
jgi:hypothetical protein